MKLSILPTYIVLVFAFCIFITARAKRNQSITAKEASSVYGLLVIFGVWTLIAIFMGMKELHVALMDNIPLLWQSCVLIVILSMGLFIKSLRDALRGIASGTPQHWMVFIQVLRIGALGSVMKALKGEITSSFPLWVGIPDFLFGLSALLLGFLVLKQRVSDS